MIEPEPYWDGPLSQVDAATPHAQLISQLVDYAPFHYSSSSLSAALSSHALRYEKDAEASNGRQSLLLPTAPVPDSTLFAPFDYDSSSSTCALSVGSTSPAPQPPYTEDMHHSNIYNDPPHQFHQLQRSVPHTAIPSAHPVQVDHYTASVPHEERSLSHAVLTARHQPTRAQTSAEAYFPASQLPGQHASHVPPVSLLDKPDTYYHTSPDPQLDVSALHSPDPLSLPEPRPVYHYAHSRPRVVETIHGQEQHGDYHHNHVQPVQSRLGHQLSRPPTAPPSDTRYALQQPERRHVNTPTQPEAGPSRRTPDLYYPLHASQLVRRSTASPRSVGVPYTKRPSLDTEDNHAHSFRPVPRQKMGATASKRDSQAQLRLSSDLQATPE
jgi:hypothetical protein